MQEGHQKNYREVSNFASRQAIELMTEVQKELEPEEDAIQDFFCASQEDHVELDEKEKRDFDLFRSYALKRIFYHSLHPTTEEVQEASESFSYHERVAGSVGTAHDIAHALAAYQGRDKNKVLPTFIEVGVVESYENRDALTEELVANLWGFGAARQVGNIFVRLMRERNPIPLVQRSLREKDDHAEGGAICFAAAEASIERLRSNTCDSFDSVLNAYEEIHLSYFLSTLQNELRKIAKKTNSHFDQQRFEKVTDSFFKCFTALREQRPPHYLALAKSIYEGLDADPKLFVHEFQRVADPLLSRLRRNNAGLGSVELE